MKWPFTAWALALLLPAGAPRQEEDRPRFDFEEFGKFTDLVRKLGKATSCRILMARDVEEKEVAVSLKQARFFEVLDALCRAHGNVRYFLPEHLAVTDDLTLATGEWVEHPASYDGHFKVVVSYFMKTRGASIDGAGAWVDVGFALLAPPWVRVTYGSGAQLEWKLEEARDKDGKDLLLKKDEEPGFRQYYALMGEDAQHGNVSDYRFTLKDFNITRKLSSLAGRIELKSNSSKVMRVDLEIGKSVEVPGGSVTVDSLTEMERHGRGMQWRAGLTFAPKEGERNTFRKILEDDVRFDGDRDWNPAFPKWKGMSFELDSFGLPGKPRWMEIRVRTGEQKSKVEFKFKDVTFKKEF